MQRNAFRKQGEGWLVAFEGRSMMLGLQKGAHYVAHLLARPGEPIHVFDLTHAANGRKRNAHRPAAVPPQTESSERVRKAVANRIRHTIAQVDRAHPDLARHLRTAIRTGTFCSYAPGRTFEWDL
jgi:hypothetical protein